MISSENLAVRLGGIFTGDPATITGFATDSREVQPGDAFLAISGARTDGHDHVHTAFANGAVVAIVEREISGPHILVPNLVNALADLALSYRQEFKGPVIGITGSAGKTTTKEFLAAALGPLGPILSTRGNRNTEFTAPLLWTEVSGETRVVVVEMAMRGFGQIAHLASFSRPTIGVITNVGYSHLLQVGSREGIAQAKAELFNALPAEGIAVYPADDDFTAFLAEQAGSRRRLTFGFEPTADAYISNYHSVGMSQFEITGHSLGQPFKTTLPVIGKHMALNAASAILVATQLGVPAQLAADQLSGVLLPPMRMEIRDCHGVTVLIDTYNASPASMIAALEALSEQTVKGKRRAIIGEMKELGNLTEQAHRMVASAIVRNEIDDVILVGDTAEIYADQLLHDGYPADRIHISKSLTDLRKFMNSSQPGDMVLIKGSRALELERVLK